MDFYKSLQWPVRAASARLSSWIPDGLAMRFLQTKNISTIALASQVVLGLGAEKSAFDVFQFVDPLIGTSEGGNTLPNLRLEKSEINAITGHVFPGATLPFGMAKAVADVNDPDEKQGGFASGDSDITGFSHMHDSGTGGVRLS